MLIFGAAWRIPQVAFSGACATGRVVSTFPSPGALERLMGALLLETQETWLAEPPRYLVLERQV